MRRLKFIALASVIVLTACSDTPPERSDDGREATGEVLGGSISDEMLPLDQLRSQSPPVRERTVTTSDADGSTTVDTSVSVTNGEGADDQSAPPEPPAPPEG